jgi:hypothetical protein
VAAIPMRARHKRVIPTGVKADRCPIAGRRDSLCIGDQGVRSRPAAVDDSVVERLLSAIAWILPRSDWALSDSAGCCCGPECLRPDARVLTDQASGHPVSQTRDRPVGGVSMKLAISMHLTQVRRSRRRASASRVVVSAWLTIHFRRFLSIRFEPATVEYRWLPLAAHVYGAVVPTYLNWRRSVFGYSVLWVT